MIVRLSIAAAIATLCHGGAAVAQSPAPGPTFEVASVKPNNSGASNSLSNVRPGGRYTATNVALRLLIREAYNLRDAQLIDAPPWTMAEHFDIAAKAAGETEYKEILLMLQSLLAERFRLTVHKDTRELPIYALVVARSDGKLGPQLVQAPFDCTDPANKQAAEKVAAQCGTSVNTSSVSAKLQGNFIPLSQLATVLSGFAGRIVLDRTGLADAFNVTLAWTPNQTADTSGASLFTAVQEQLGLKLEPSRGPVDVIVVDRVERPTPD